MGPLQQIAALLFFTDNKLKLSRQALFWLPETDMIPGSRKEGVMNELKIKVTVILSTIFNFLGILAIPVICLLPLNLIDYWTGINAAPYRDKQSSRPVKSYKSIRGINKKVSMYLLILVGWIVDKLIKTSLCYIGLAINFQLFAITIACWLCFNEVISIVENMEDSGAAIPPFLMPLLKKIKKQINEVGNTEESEDE